MRVVIKIGTSTLTHTTGNLNIRRVEELCKVISDIKNAGNQVILVSSGAIGMGVGKLGLLERPKDVPTKQAAAAVGQCELMYFYDKIFGEYHHIVAQLLITNEDMLIAADLLKGGYRLAYCAKAMVHHSHSYTFMQEYRRNRLIGRFMQRYSQRLHGATETGEGLRLMVFVLAQLARKGQFMECIRFVMNCAARLLGSRAGRRMEKKAMGSAKD